jgi:protein-tyrosine phosphatase
MSYKIMTVCTGNICRSVMGEIVLKDYVQKNGISDIEVVSTGCSSEEQGSDMDERTRAVLLKNNYKADLHIARKLTYERAIAQDLILPMTSQHFHFTKHLLESGEDVFYYSFAKGKQQEKSKLVSKENLPDLIMYRAFEEGYKKLSSGDMGPDMKDPWYGGSSEFDVALKEIEMAAPNIIKYALEHQK